MRSTHLAKNSPERLAGRRAASSCNAFAIATIVIIIITITTNILLFWYFGIIIIIMPWYFIPTIIKLAKVRMYVRNGYDGDTEIYYYYSVLHLP